MDEEDEDGGDSDEDPDDPDSGKRRRVDEATIERRIEKRKWTDNR